MVSFGFIVNLFMIVFLFFMKDKLKWLKCGDEVIVLVVFWFMIYFLL